MTMTKDEMIAELQSQFSGINELGARDTVNALLENDEIPCDAYDIFFDHYCMNGEMPYGTAKAKDGDPIEWIHERIATELGL